MHPATEAGEMVLRVLALAVTREPIPGRRRRITAPRAFVTGIGPWPGGLSLAGAGRQHLDRRIVGEDRFGRQDMAADGPGQGFQQGGGLADPVGQRGAVEVEALPVEDPALAIEWQVIGIFADQHMGQETRTGTAAFDRARG